MRRRPSKPNFEEFSVCLVEEELDSFPASEHGHHLSLLGLLPYLVLQYLVCSTAAFWAAFSWVSSTITGQLGEGKRSNEMSLIYTRLTLGSKGR